VPCEGTVPERVEVPPGKGSLQPEAIAAGGEATDRSKPAMERVVKRLRECAGRNASEC